MCFNFKHLTMNFLLFASFMPFLLVGFSIAPSVLLTLLGIFLLLVIIFASEYLFSYRKEKSRLKDQRPPVAGPILNLRIHFDRLYDYQTSLAKKYTTYRMIRPTHSEIYTVDPVNVEYFLKTNFSNYDRGALNVDVMRDLFGDGIFTADGDKWRHQRKLASYEFSTRVLRDFSSSVFRANAAKLASKVNVAATALQSIDIQDTMMKSTLDSIFKVGFGVELNALSGVDDFGSRFAKAFDDSNSIVFFRYVDPVWKVKRFLNIGSEASLKQNIKVIDDFVFGLIKCKREQMKNGKLAGGKEDILSRFLLESEKDPENMTDQYLRDIILNFMIAGKDTTANTLSWFFYMLCRHPLVQEKIVQEVRQAAGAVERMSAEEFSELMTEEALNKMKYLHASLTETLRLYPAVPLDGKSAAEDDTLPDGFKLKKGDGINYMTYAMGRMKDIWGDDAEEFRPERWLHDGVFRPESPFKFTSFHAGPRVCLGKEFAYRQMKIFAAVLLHFFRFKLVDERKEVRYRTMFTLHLDGGLHLYAIPRLQNS